MRNDATLQTHSPPRRRPWRHLSPLGLVATTLVVVLGSAVSGCSCTRRPEWDSGLERRERPTRQTGGTEAGGSATPGAAGSGSGNGGGEGGGGGTGAGTGAGGGASGTGEQGQGDGGRGPAGGNGTGTADGPTKGSQEVAGPGSGTAAGAGDETAQPPAALPGRPRPKPRYDAGTASEVAERKLRSAEASQRKGDLGEAYAAALEAFEAVEPHAATDDSCKVALSRAKQMLTELAESQNRKTRPRAVPTLFE
jgi:hypothetical protein